MTPEQQKLYNIVENAYKRHGFQLVAEPWGRVYTCKVSKSTSYVDSPAPASDITVCINTEVPCVHTESGAIDSEIYDNFEAEGYEIVKSEYFYDFHIIYLKKVREKEEPERE